MSQRDVMLALALGAGAGLMFSTAATRGLGGLVLSYFCVLPLYVVGLRSGTAIQGAAVAAGLLVTAALLGAVPGGLPFAFFLALPAHLLTMLALRRDEAGEWYPTGRLAFAASSMAAAGSIMICVVIGAFAADGQTAESMIAISIERLLSAEMAGDTVDPDRAAQMKRLVTLFAAILPGMVASSWLMLQFVNGTIAQALLVAGKRALRPTPRLQDLVLPKGMLVAMVVVVAVAVAGGDTVGYMAANVAVVLATAFLLQGLGVVHAAIRLWSASALPLVVFYVVLGLFGGLAIAIVILGLAETLVHVRDRLNRRKNGGRS